MDISFVSWLSVAHTVLCDPKPPAEYQPTQKSRRIYRRHAGPGCLVQGSLTGINLYNDLRGSIHARQQDQGMAQVTPIHQKVHNQQAVQNTE